MSDRGESFQKPRRYVVVMVTNHPAPGDMYRVGVAAFDMKEAEGRALVMRRTTGGATGSPFLSYDDQVLDIEPYDSTNPKHADIKWVER